MYTSGSTGRPKGVVLPHCGVVAAGYMWGMRMELKETDVILGVNPQFHVGGMKNVHIAMACGGAYMMQQQFSRTRFWRDVKLSGATAGVLMPAMCSILLTEPPGPDDRDNSIRRIVSHFVNREFEERFDIDILTCWGMSETSGTATMTSPHYPEKLPNLAGWPTHQLVEVAVRDDEGKDLPTGITGELWARHPWQFTGYLNDPVGTSETIVDGWIRSGDLGHIDDQGRVYYEGRKKNMIKRAGENVSGLEVEQCLMSHPDISEAGVFGVPDPIRTEEVKAVLVLRPDAAVTFPELAQWCEDRLSPFKVPRYWEVRTELPRAAVHKVSLPQLRKEHDPSNPGWDRTLS
jgi:crotonobetaine/carnitine-CoA ligase